MFTRFIRSIPTIDYDKPLDTIIHVVGFWGMQLCIILFIVAFFCWIGSFIFLSLKSKRKLFLWLFILAVVAAVVLELVAVAYVNFADIKLSDPPGGWIPVPSQELAE